MNGATGSTSALNNSFANDDEILTEHDIMSQEFPPEDDNDRMVPLVRDEEFVVPVPKGKKKKAKAKKENILPLSIEFKKKPDGYSSSTRFVGDDDDDDYDVPFEEPNVEPVAHVKPDVAKSNQIMEINNIEIDDVDDDVSSVSSVSFKSNRPNVIAGGQFCGTRKPQINGQITNDLQDEVVKLRSQLKTYQKENLSLQEQIEKLNQELQHMQSNTKNDSKKLIKENAKLKEKFAALQKDLTSKEDECHRINCEKNAFFERVQTLEKEKKRLQQTIAQNETLVDADEHKHRAVCAEITVLELQKIYELELKEKAVKDAKKVVSHLDLIISKCMPDDAVAARKYQDEFREIVETFEKQIEKLKKDYDAQIELVKGGKQLSSLKRIEIPKPPTPPPVLELKGFSADNQNAANSNIGTSTYNPSTGGIRPLFSATRSSTDVFRPPAPPPPQIFQAPPRPPVINQVLPPAPIPSTTMPPGFGGFPPNPQPMPQNFPKQGLSQNQFIPPLFGTKQPTPMNNPMPPGRLPLNTPPHRPMMSRPMPSDLRPPGLNPAFCMQMPQPISTLSNSFSQLSSNPNSAVSTGCMPHMQMSTSNGQQINGGYDSSVVPKMTSQEQKRPDESESGSLASARPSQAASPTPAAGKQSQKIDKIYEYFKDRFPTAVQEDVKQAIQKFREKQPSKKLSGLTMQQLKSGVEPILIELFGLPISSKSGSSTRASSVLGEPTPHLSGLNRLEEDDCFICMMPKNHLEIQTLECGHEAHRECLNLWILERKTCPICRKLALSEDEYPRL